MICSVWFRNQGEPPGTGCNHSWITKQSPGVQMGEGVEKDCESSGVGSEFQRVEVLAESGVEEGGVSQHSTTSASLSSHFMCRPPCPPQLVMQRSDSI